MHALDPNIKPPFIIDMEAFLARRIKGQPQAIKALSKAHAAFKSGIRKYKDQGKKRPIAVLLFWGPSRTGKTEIGRAAAQYFHGTPTAATLISCVEYQDRHEVAKLIGSPPGYIGYDEKPRLSKEKLYSKIPGYQIKTSTSGSKDDKQEKQETHDKLLKKVDIFLVILNELNLIDQALRNNNRELSWLKKRKLNEQKFKTEKDILNHIRAFLNYRRSHILNSYLETAEEFTQDSKDTHPKETSTHPTTKKLTPQIVYPKSISAKVATTEEPILVIIFDEIEKAHENLRRFLINLMDEGNPVLGNGEEIDLSNIVVILTSNIASKLIGKATKGVAEIGFQFGRSKDNLEKLAKAELKKLFSQEFLNRLDDVVMFNILSPNDFKDILELQIEDLSLFLEKAGLAIEIKPEVKEIILEETAKNPEGQVKSLRDCFKKYIDDPIGNLLTNGQLSGKKKIFVTLENRQVVFKA